MMSGASRREFLKRLSAMSALGAGVAPWAMNLAGIGAASNAQAASASGYKALVCIFLVGGNDAYNTVLATDSESWTHYQSVRQEDVSVNPNQIALLKDAAPDLTATLGTPASMGGVLSVGSSALQGGRSFAFHPMLKRIQALYQSGQAAVVSNVGPLKVPTTPDQFAAGLSLPSKLFSHNDQQSTWQTFGPEGTTSGWGGRLADLLVSQDTTGGSNPSPVSVFKAISTAGNAVWLSGNQVRQYQVSPTGAVAVAPGEVYGSADVYAAIKRSMLGQNGSAQTAGLGWMEQDLGALAQRSFDAEGTLSGALSSAASAPFGTQGSPYDDPVLMYTNPVTGKSSYNFLAHQLQAVARIIEARRFLGVKRQVFFVSLSGFDTHDTQNGNHANALAQLDHAVGYFYNVLSDPLLNLANSVTAFTASDFGRSFTSNGDGTDHGWGGHHFVVGGAVKGGEVYGKFPAYGTLDPNSSRAFFTGDSQINNGILVPTTSVDQYAAKLATWLGASDAGLSDIFPNLGNFSLGADAKLDFMKV